MSEELVPIWCEGPKELLDHSLQLMRTGGASNLRLAFIAIDNAVETMAKVFLELPKRTSGINVSTKEYANLQTDFLLLIEGVERHAGSRVDNIDFSEILWMHKTRNRLYHQGSGLTVDLDQTRRYFNHASEFFEALFEVNPETDTILQREQREKLLSLWKRISNALFSEYPEYRKTGGALGVMALYRNSKFSTFELVWAMYLFGFLYKANQEKSNEEGWITSMEIDLAETLVASLEREIDEATDKMKPDV